MKKLLTLLAVATLLFSQGNVGGGGVVVAPASNSGGGSGLLPWNPILSAPPLTANNWTFNNPDAAGTFTDAHNSVVIAAPTGGNNIKAALRSAPTPSGTPFTITAHINATCIASSNNHWGIIVVDTGTKMVDFNFRTTASALGFMIMAQDNATDYTSNPIGGATESFTGGANMVWPTDLWMRVIYNATPNFIFQVSGTGDATATWITIDTVSATAVLATAPSKIGFDVYGGTGGTACVAVLGYWVVS